MIVATNGYTGEITPWLRRRVIPIGSYVIATCLPGFVPGAGLPGMEGWDVFVRGAAPGRGPVRCEGRPGER